MSGHSHWATIKHKKGSADAQRSREFAKIAKEIVIAARDGGDPSSNPRLRQVIEKARSLNMPTNNIERAVKRGTGELEGARLEEIMLEAYGPGGMALLISGITDNKNRTLGEIKQILRAYEGKLVEGGAVRWLFERKGTLLVRGKDGGTSNEDLEMKVIEAGADHMFWREDTLEVHVSPQDLERTKRELSAIADIVSASVDWVPKERTAIPEKQWERAEGLFAALDEHDAVQDVYSNT